MTQTKYINKKDVINRGFIKKNGTIYKQSLIEIWYNKGWLELNNSNYNSEDRLKAGLKLALDFHIINRANLHSSHIINDKIDNNYNNESFAILDAKKRYQQAIKSIPAEFWPIVRQICIEEKDPIPPLNTSERQRAYFYYMCRIDLCRGLDRILVNTTKS
ncbi:MAG: hypothetical protein E7020_02915 [Alphaproteobacteria bacterium]|nr:hypothetical protein [Alphaproteobacteria bacterium]